MRAKWQKCGRLVLISLCAVLCIPATAQLLPVESTDEEEIVEDVRLYSVEVIVFEYASSVSAGNEVFDPIEIVQPEEPQSHSTDAISVYGDTAAETGNSRIEDETAEAVEFGDFEHVQVEEITELELIPSLSTIDFKLLTPEELTMVEIHKKLLTLDAYRPVLWGGWVQSTQEQEVTPSIHLRALGIPPVHIDGTLTLFLKNYLHLVVDLTREQKIATVQPAYPQQAPSRPGERPYYDDAYRLADTQTIVYRIQENRLFQSGQLRYYDHPKFGVLARVNRIEKEIPEDGTENDEEPIGPSMLSYIE